MSLLKEIFDDLTRKSTLMSGPVIELKLEPTVSEYDNNRPVLGWGGPERCLEEELYRGKRVPLVRFSSVFLVNSSLVSVSYGLEPSLDSNVVVEFQVLRIDLIQVHTYS